MLAFPYVGCEPALIYSHATCVRWKACGLTPDWVCRFKGVGPKTVACVMMFCLARDEFPVDTHVWRISKNMGWVPTKANRDDTYRHMNIRVPADLR